MMLRHSEDRKLPVGIQDFEKLRTNHFLYVDKTAYIYDLVHTGMPYFLSRPRRFGKSLFLSTLRAYWEGRRDLFEGLEIVRLEEGNPDAWQPYPVFYFDFNRKNFQRETALEEVLSAHLDEWEQIYGEPEKANIPLEERFQLLLQKAKARTGKNCVVLVDEYDKPLLETMENHDLIEHNKAVFKGFFSTLKSYDGYLQFVFLTGVTKFSKVSIFSDLNHLTDISLTADYAGICGITEAELRENFAPEIKKLADFQQMTETECYESLARTYDGYHFYPNAEGVYNPYSVLVALMRKDIGYFWFETGTPTFLVEMLKKTDFDPRQFTEGELYAGMEQLSDYRADNMDPIPLFYQSGYLTIQGYERRNRSCLLGYPNEEVKYGFVESLIPMFVEQKGGRSPLDIRSFEMDIERGDLDKLRDRFTALFASLPYPTDSRPVEMNFQNVIYIVFTLLGQFVHSEVHSAKGRADCIVETEEYIYIFEFKRDATAQEALAQIEEKGYATPYAADERQIYRIGVNFDSEKRELAGWEVR